MPQSDFTPGLPAPLVVLGLLATGLSLAAALAAALLALALGRRRLARRLAAASLCGAAAYLAVLVGVSLASRDRVLRRGDRKYFCEVDCHLAYSIEEVTRTKALGVPPQVAAAGGVFTAVRVRTWFDERTISPFRGNGPLSPGSRVVFVVDESGRRYLPSAAAASAFEEGRPSSIPITRPLRPGESYLTTFVFDLPESVRGPRLFVGDPPGPERFVIDHEDSPFHGKIYFAL